MPEQAKPQPSLFEDPAAVETVAADIDNNDISKAIREAAPRVVHPDRTSEAARDQGWGPAPPAAETDIDTENLPGPGVKRSQQFKPDTGLPTPGSLSDTPPEVVSSTAAGFRKLKEEFNNQQSKK